MVQLWLAAQLLLHDEAPPQASAQLEVHALMLHSLPPEQFSPQPFPAHSTLHFWLPPPVQLVEQLPPGHFTVQLAPDSHVVAHDPPSQVNVHVALPLQWNAQLALLSPPHDMSQLAFSQVQSAPAVHLKKLGAPLHPSKASTAHNANVPDAPRIPCDLRMMLLRVIGHPTGRAAS